MDLSSFDTSKQRTRMEEGEVMFEDDKVLVLGYYSWGGFLGDFRDSWEQSLPLPNVGRLVFCGVLVDDYDSKVEISLHIEEENNKAFVSMSLVEEYGNDMLYVTKDFYNSELEDYQPAFPELILPCFFDQELDSFDCALFTVHDDAWNSFQGKQPFTLNESWFLCPAQEDMEFLEKDLESISTEPEQEIESAEES